MGRCRLLRRACLPFTPAQPPQACRTEAEYAFQQHKRIVPIRLMHGGPPPSQACRTEAEYAFQQHKRIVPIRLMHGGPPPSQACRTEAEYAFQQRKRIVPIIMEVGYKPSGWLGALMGTRLYFDMSDVNRVPSKVPSLIKVSS